MASWGSSWAGGWAGGWNGGEGAGSGPIYLEVGFAVLIEAESAIGAATSVHAGMATSAIATAALGSQVSGGQPPQLGFTGGVGGAPVQQRRLRLVVSKPDLRPEPKRLPRYIDATMTADAAAVAAFSSDACMTYARARAEEEDLMLLLLAAA